MIFKVKTENILNGFWVTRSHLDYPTLEAIGSNYEDKLKEKEREIEYLRERNAMSIDAIAALSERVAKLDKHY